MIILKTFSSWRSLLWFFPYFVGTSGYLWKLFRICLLMQFDLPLAVASLNKVLKNMLQLQSTSVSSSRRKEFWKYRTMQYGWWNITFKEWHADNKKWKFVSFIKKFIEKYHTYLSTLISIVYQLGWVKLDCQVSNLQCLWVNSYIFEVSEKRH